VGTVALGALGAAAVAGRDRHRAGWVGSPPRGTMWVALAIAVAIVGVVRASPTAG
jgi:hypothetical protein